MNNHGMVLRNSVTKRTKATVRKTGYNDTGVTIVSTISPIDPTNLLTAGNL